MKAGERLLIVTKCLGDMVQNAWENIAENLGFVENSNFIRESTEAAVSRFSVVNSHESTCGRVQLYIKVTELNRLVLL